MQEKECCGVFEVHPNADPALLGVIRKISLKRIAKLKSRTSIS